jgi:hypothetical protein
VNHCIIDPNTNNGGKMKLKFRYTLCTVFVVLLTQSLFAQRMMIKATGDVFNMAELSAVISENDGKVVVLLTKSDLRPAAYKDIDIKTDDEIFMANGKKIKSVKELQNLYNELKPGDDLKMAIKRGDERKLVSVIKADPKDLPKVKIKTETITPEEAAKLEEEGGTRIIKKTVGPDGETKTEVIENGKPEKKDDEQ